MQDRIDWMVDLLKDAGIECEWRRAEIVLDIPKDEFYISLQVVPDKGCKCRVREKRWRLIAEEL